MAKDFTYVGQGRPIKDAVQKVTGTLKYTVDLTFPQMLHAGILFSPVPHARIKTIDTSKAVALPGVHSVLTYENTPQIPYNSSVRFPGQNIPENELVFSPVVRFVGDRVAAVAAESPELVKKALNLIKVEYEELPAVYDPEEALLKGAPQLHPGGNKLGEVLAEAGNIEQGMDEADLVFEDRITIPMAHQGALEPHSCVAVCDVTDTVTVYTPSQNIYAVRLVLARLLALPMHKVRVIKPPMGGSFGGKLEMVIEPIAALLAYRTKRPVKLVLNRQETMVSTRTRHAVTGYLRTGVTKEGKLVAQDIKLYTCPGAYASSAINLPAAMTGKVFSFYRIPNLRFRGIPVYTNTPIAGAMRGYGSTQLVFCIETHLNRIAKELGIDPVKFHLMNLVKPGDVDPRNGKELGNCRIIDCVKKGAEAFGWEEKQKQPHHSDKVRRGIGMACGVHGNGLYPVHYDFTTMTLKLNEDGTACLLTGTMDMGSGSTTAFTQIIGEVLGLNPDNIAVMEGDTSFTPYDLGCYASRSIWVSGNAAKKVAEKVLELLKEEAGKLLGVPKSRLIAKDGQLIYLDNKTKRASLSQTVLYAMQHSQRDIIATETFQTVAGPCSYGAHFAEVEVELESGEVRVLNYVAAHDIGRAINPLSVEGQIEGAVQMGIGLATREKLILEPDTGKISNASFKKYKMLKASEMPTIKVLLVEEGEDPGPFGAKSIGEISVVPSPAAVVNAISDAVGTNFFTMPVTPEQLVKVLRKESSLDK